MYGPEILVKTLTKAVPTGQSGKAWQYHSRSDRHSKAACWGVLLDLLATSHLLQQRVREGRVAFGINHEMRDFKQNKKKNLDLVLCTPASDRRRSGRRFADLARQYQLELGPDAERALEALPVLFEAPVGSVHVALEAKACMTAHSKAIPRLYDELNSSHQTIHGASEDVIAAGFVMVNIADEFASPGRVGYCPHCKTKMAPVNEHKQPEDAIRVIEKMKELPRRSKPKEDGFDALAIVVVDCKNDGSPVQLVTTPPAPQPGDIFRYEQMISRLAGTYESRFLRG